MTASLDKVQSEILLGVREVTEKQLGDGLQSALRGRQTDQGGAEDAERGHHLRADVQLAQLEFSQGFEGQEVKLELVGYELTAPDVLCGANHTECFQLTAGVCNIGEVQPLVLRVDRRPRTLQPLTDGV